MDEVLGYDCDGNEIYEFMILRAIFSNDIDIEDLKDADPRQYCAVVADDGNAYAISVFDNWNYKLIAKREHIHADSIFDIPTIVKPISEMENYEMATCCYESNIVETFYYYCNRDELKNKLNKILREQKTYVLKKEEKI